jgi:hypothetical protein
MKQHTDMIFCTDFTSTQQDLLDTSTLLKKFKDVPQSDLDKLMELLPVRLSTHLIHTTSTLNHKFNAPEKYELSVEKMLKQIFKVMPSISYCN